MSFSVSCAGCGLEYSGRRPFAQRRNAASPRFHALLWEIGRWLRTARRSLDEADYEGARSRDYLDAHGYSQRFRSPLPRAAHVGALVDRSGPGARVPAAYAIRFFDNHGMLGFGRFRWRTVTGGSRVYVGAHRRAARRRPPPRAGRARDPARRRTASRCGRDDGEPRRFDQRRRRHARRPGARAARGPERRRAARRSAASPTRETTPSSTRTRRFLPRSRRAPAPRGTTALGDDGRPTITYYLNRLQRLDADARLLRHAEPARAASEHVLARFSYRTRSYTVETLRGAARAAAPLGRAAHALRGRPPRQRLPRGRPRLRRRAPRPRSGSTGEVGALHRHADARAARRRSANVFRYPVSYCLLDLDELPELERRLRLVSANRRGARQRSATATTSTAAPVKQAVLDFAGDPSIERVLMLDAAARARLRLQPGHRSSGATAADGDARLHGRRAQQHLRRAAARSSCTGPTLRYAHDKRLHVSPFFGLDQSLPVRVLAARRARSGRGSTSTTRAARGR